MAVGRRGWCCNVQRNTHIKSKTRTVLSKLPDPKDLIESSVVRLALRQL